MGKTRTEDRYQVGYNRPVEGAFGDSPREFHFVNDFDDLQDAIAEVNNLREHSSGDQWSQRAFIVDALTGALVPLVTGSDGKAYSVDDSSIPG
jgi:hypothetical protein